MNKDRREYPASGLIGALEEKNTYIISICVISLMIHQNTHYVIIYDIN